MKRYGSKILKRPYEPIHKAGECGLCDSWRNGSKLVKTRRAGEKVKASREIRRQSED